MKPSVLFVDDQSSLLQSLRRSLRGHEAAWDIQYATGGTEAARIMSTVPIDVVVSDTNMPGIRGTELLTDIQKQYPRTVRMVLSGGCRNDDISLLLRTSHQFFSKPFDVNMLLKTVEKIVSLRDKIKDEKMQAFIAGVTQLPCAPAIHGRFHEELNNITPDLDRLAEYIAQDPGLTAKLLQSLNSTFFGVNKAGIHPYKAVRFMGAGTIFHLFVDSVHFNTVEKDHPNYSFIEDLYRDSLRCAYLMESLAEAEGLADKDRELAFTLGLVHEIGTIMLASEMGAEYAKIVPVALEKGQAEQMAAERKAFGASHCEIGAYLLALWGYPPAIIDAVSYHLEPATITIPFVDLTAMLHIAHALVCGKEGKHGGSELSMPYLQKLGIVHRLPQWQELNEKVGQMDAVKNWKF